MTVRLTISDEAATWLYQSITKTLGRVHDAQAEYSAELTFLLEDLLNTLHEATQHPEAPKPPKKLPKAAPPPTNYCSAHPKYQAKRSPKTECETCWAVYTRLNPTLAALARRRHDRNVRTQL